MATKVKQRYCEKRAFDLVDTIRVATPPWALCEGRPQFSVCVCVCARVWVRARVCVWREENNLVITNKLICSHPTLIPALGLCSIPTTFAGEHSAARRRTMGIRPHASQMISVTPGMKLYARCQAGRV